MLILAAVGDVVEQLAEDEGWAPEEVWPEQHMRHLDAFLDGPLAFLTEDEAEAIFGAADPAERAHGTTQRRFDLPVHDAPDDECVGVVLEIVY